MITFLGWGQRNWDLGETASRVRSTMIRISMPEQIRGGRSKALGRVAAGRSSGPWAGMEQCDGCRLLTEGALSL